ncbi:STAGA complex 65 subunit gamma [Nymphon striatum]|nr:STAGA complex 65 subunit gamma [Nymphon striatum]
MSYTKLWGEIPLTSDTESSIAALEREQITKRKALPVDGPRLFQPSETLIPISKLPSRSFTYNPVIIHTIKLLLYANKVRNLINQLQEITVCVNSNTTNFPSTPLTPSSHECTECRPDPDAQNDFLNSKIFSNPMKKLPEEISNTQVERLSRFDIGVICAHTGFDITTDSVLDFFADVSRSYTQQICKLLRHAVDNEVFNCGGNSGDTLFVASILHSLINVLERVFHDIGIGNITSLEEFYESRVIQYHKNVSKNCKSLQEEYEKLRNADNKAQFEDLKMIRIKEEFPMIDAELLPTKEKYIKEIRKKIGDEEKSGMLANDSSAPFEEFQNPSNIESSIKEEENMKWLSATSSNIKQENSQPDLDFDDEIINVSDSPSSNEVSKTVSKDPNAVTGLDGSSPNRLLFQKLPKIR